MAADTITASRVALVPLTEPVLAALLDGRREDAERLGRFTLPPGWPDERDARFLDLRLRDVREHPAWTKWLVRAVVLRTEQRPLVGHAGFHGPPGVNALDAPDALEVGYAIVPDQRGRGYATEAARALLAWAEGQGIHRFVASIAPANAPSLALARRLGFREVGRHWDAEDGDELEFELVTLSGAV